MLHVDELPHELNSALESVRLDHGAYPMHKHFWHKLMSILYPLRIESTTSAYSVVRLVQVERYWFEEIRPFAYKFDRLRVNRSSVEVM